MPSSSPSLEETSARINCACVICQQALRQPQHQNAARTIALYREEATEAGQPCRTVIVDGVLYVLLWGHRYSMAEFEHGALVQSAYGEFVTSVALNDEESEEDEGLQSRCHMCNTICNVDDMYTDDYGTETCSDCWEDYTRTCEWCDATETTNSRYRTIRDHNVIVRLNGYSRDISLCDGCSPELDSCYDCGDYMAEDVVQYHGDEPLCPDCYNNQSARVVHSYSYTPNLVFWRLDHQKINSPYFGMEIEAAGYNGYNQISAWYTEEIADDYEDLIYLKEDSSISDGLEIVTHPMTFEWAMQNFPWDKLDKLIGRGINPSHQSTGGHVHISKDAFTSSHMWKFLQFHMKMSQFCGMLGGRGSNDRWGSFDTMKDEISLKELTQIAKRKYNSRATRYFAVNLLPQQTVELRYPAGGASKELAKKNLMLAHAIFSYTKEITMDQVKAGALNDAGYFLFWIQSRAETYPELLSYILTMFPMPKPFPTKETN